MKVMLVEVTYIAKRGLPNYSSKGGEIKMNAEVEAGEDWQDVMRTLSDGAKALLHETLRDSTPPGEEPRRSITPETPTNQGAPSTTRGRRPDPPEPMP